jgi:WD40 repeat protein/serine/threonine protein kinase/DNA-binding XRE family transcriptional regulator
MAAELPFGRLVRERRRALDLTQEELANRVGCAPITLRKIEYGDLRPSEQIAERLAVALAVPPHERPAFVRQARAVRPEPRSRPNTLPTPTSLTKGAEPAAALPRGYRLGAQIGAGGFGAVYHAVQPGIEREVAVKVILPQYADHPAFIRRFEAEAQVVARLEHPHIVPLYDYWREPGVAFLVMRYLRGGSLQRQLTEAPLDPQGALQVLDQIGSGLSLAHAAGVVHRDLKPANILLDEAGNAYLADFGIAKDLARPADLSFGGAFVGSPAYAAPEQLRAEPITPQTDIYALGALLFELLSGRRPFDGSTPALLVQQHLSAPVPLLTEYRAGLPVALNHTVQRAMAKLPAARFANIREFLAELHAVVLPPSTSLAPATSARAAPPTEVLDLDDHDSPYVGLRPFDEADAAQFFGRGSLVQQLLVRLGESGDLARLLAVIGPSGSGKSSVVRAGLIPSLRAGGLPGSEQWFIVTFVPGPAPLEALALALRRVAPTSAEADDLRALLATDTRGLLRAARLILPPDEMVELVLVIDQFEELFTLCADEATRAHLLDSLVTATLDERSRVRVILTLRADIIDRPLQYVDFGELLRRRSELVGPMTPDELEQAILGPARQLGLVFEDGLVMTLVGAVMAQPGALPLLQHALNELFCRRAGRVLTRGAYEQLGGVQGALARSAEAIYAALTLADQALAQQLFLRLVTPGETGDDLRRQMRRRELLANEGDIVVRTFEQARLITLNRDAQTREPTVEVAHEALLHEWPRLRGWIETARADLQVLRQLATAAEEWAGNRQDASYLATGVRLTQFTALAESAAIQLDAGERAYLVTSQALAAAQTQAAHAQAERELQQTRALAEEQRRRADETNQAAIRLRRRAIALAVALLGATVAAMTAWVAAINSAKLSSENVAIASTAVANFGRSEAQRLAAEANALAQTRGSAETIALLALRSLNLQYTPQGDAALQQAASGTLPRRIFAGHSDAVQSVAIAPDGATVLTGSLDRTARLWDLQTGQELRQFVGHSDGITSVAFAPDGATILTGSLDTTSRLWDVRSGATIHTFSGHSDRVWSVAFAPDGGQILTASQDGTARLWDVATGQEIRALSLAPVGIWSATFSPDGTQVLTGDQQNTAEIWERATGQVRRVFHGHTAPVLHVAFSPDGKTALTSADDGMVRLWDVETGTVVQTLTGHDDTINSAHFSPDGKTVLTSSHDRTARLWDVQTAQELRRFVGHTGFVNGAAFSPDGRFIVTGSNDMTARLWDLQEAPRLLDLPGVSGFALAFAPDGRSILTGDTAVQLRELPAGRELRSFAASTKDTGYVTDVVVSPDQRSAIVSYEGGTVQLWDIQTGELIRSFVGHTKVVRSVAFSPDGRYVLTGSYDTTVRLWDTQSGQIIRVFTGHTAEVQSVAFAQNGRQIASGGNDHTARLWDVSTGRQTQVFSTTANLGAVALAPDSSTLLTGGRELQLWDVQTGRELRTFDGHSAAIMSVAFGPDGQTVLSGSIDTSARLWDVATGSERRRFMGGGTPVYAVRYAPDGRTVLLGGLTGVRLFDVDYQATMRVLCTRLPRDLSQEERAQYDIHDERSTCPVQ